jgi:hypothetical protein
MDFIKLNQGQPCPILLCPMGGPPLKWPYNCFMDSPPAGRLLSPWTSNAVGEFHDQGDNVKKEYY